MKTFTYLAAAYTGVELSSFEENKRAVSLYSKVGVVVYSPIVHCHPVAKEYKLPKGYAYWQNSAQGMIRGCSAFDVLVPKGWEQKTLESTGVKAEARYAHGRGIPVRIVTMRGDLIVELTEADNEIRYKLLGGM